jgi:HAD superfamily hydrolase (TIGR01549 family)
MPRQLRGILFDLFGTLLYFDGRRLPRPDPDGGFATASVANLEEILSRLEPTIDREGFSRVLSATSRELAREKSRTCREVSSPERFRRAIVAAGLSGDVDRAASEMSAAHMSTLAEAVDYGRDRSCLLQRLQGRFRLGLVSNFDHGPTARRILERAGIAHLFESVVISDDVGVRKPSPRIFRHALDALGTSAADCVFVGDDYEADVGGATGAGLRAVWIDRGDRPGSPAEVKLADVDRLPAWLGLPPDPDS